MADLHWRHLQSQPSPRLRRALVRHLRRVGGSALLSIAAASATAQTALPGSLAYPRLVRLAHGDPARNGQLIASTDAMIFRSTDGGSTFTRLTTVPARPGSRHFCCSTLYEVPRDVGSIKAGTLLSAGTYTTMADGTEPPPIKGTDFNGGTPAIDVYQSTDGGSTWRWLATPVRSKLVDPGHKPPGQRGLWEPEFEVASDGSLVMFVSDETDPCCSQKLVAVRTRDGITWSDRHDIVAMPATPAARPGMIVSTPLPGGRYFLTYELCGLDHCTVYARTSADGWSFGDPATRGTRVVSTTGQTLRHSPANTFAPPPPTLPPSTPQAATPQTSGAASPGQILVIGQMLYEADGTVSPQNGTVVFSSSDLTGQSPFTLQHAPVPVPGAFDNPCPNYSSALLPSSDGRSVLELASHFDADGRCMTFVQAGPLQ